LEARLLHRSSTEYQINQAFEAFFQKMTFKGLLSYCQNCYGGRNMIVHRRKLGKRTPILPEQRAYKYQCREKHIRIEKQQLERPFPNCPACEKAGQANPFKYIGKFTIPRNQLKKSKFKE